MPVIDRPVVILSPAPQRRDRIFDPATLDRLHAHFAVVDLEDDHSPGAFTAALPSAFAIVGQPDLPAEVLHDAAALRAIVNVEGNFFPNVDYPTAFARGVRVLGCGTAYSQAVAEYALGLALDLARGISREDRAMRRGGEAYTADSNLDAILLRKANVGFVGFGNLGRAVRPLLTPFETTIRAYDPWLPAAVLEDAGVVPSTLEETLSRSDVVFVFATATTENPQFIDGAMLDLLRPGCRLILVSRAGVVDYRALHDRLAQNRFLAAIDVWPEEPLPPDDPFRRLDNVILSAHRAGGIPAAFYSIGEMVCDDLELMARGLPPIRLQSAAPEIVGRYRNKPVG
jgi:phosphoglycerate dehydrogenase-like enzyme